MRAPRGRPSRRARGRRGCAGRRGRRRPAGRRRDAREAQRGGERQPVLARVADDDLRRPLGARALRDQQPDRPGADDQHALPRDPARGAPRAAPPRSARPAPPRAARASTRCANAAGKTIRVAIAPSMCTMPVSVRRAHRWRRPATAAHAHAAADRDLPHDAIAGREPGHAAADVDHRAGPLVARHDRELGQPHPEIGQRALEDLDVGAADPDGGRRDQQLALPRGGVGPLDDLEPLFAMELDCVHMRIEQPSNELRTGDDGDGTRQAIASRPDADAGPTRPRARSGARAGAARARARTADRRRPGARRPQPRARARGPRESSRASSPRTRCGTGCVSPV